MEMTKWKELVDRFQALKNITGTNRSSSYNVSIHFGVWTGICIELGTYDVADWPRHTTTETFKTEEEALEAFEEIVKKAEQEVADYENNTGRFAEEDIDSVLLQASEITYPGIYEVYNATMTDKLDFIVEIVPSGHSFNIVKLFDVNRNEYYSRPDWSFMEWDTLGIASDGYWALYKKGGKFPEKEENE